MDAIRKKDNSLNIAAPRADHTARMDRVDTALQEQGVAVAQLTPQQTTDFSIYAGNTLDNIGKISGLGPIDLSGTGQGANLYPTGPGPVIDGRGREERAKERDQELTDKIKEKNDPEFAAKKKAERTASKLNSLFHPIVTLAEQFGSLAGVDATHDGIGTGGGIGLVNPDAREESRHKGEMEIVDTLYGLEGKEMDAVKTEYEKSYGKTLEEEVRSRFRGDSQQTLLALVRGGGAGDKAGGAAQKPAAPAEGGE